VEDCKALEDVLELRKRNDDYFFSYFYATCLLSGYQEIMPRVEAFVERIGRMLYLMPIVRAMAEAKWARDRARPLFDSVREHQHPVTANAVDALLKRAGL
jgi:hypothetical protein